MARPKTVNNEAQTTVRMPQEIMDALKEMAEQDRRSLNAQIVVTLERALKCSDKQPTHRHPAP